MKKFYPITLLFLAVAFHAYAQEVEPLSSSNQQPVVLSVGQEYDYNEQYESLNYSPSPTGNSSEPGNTPGELSVSASGGASYDIPIQVPDGINGVHPELYLSYNSQSGNGTAGYGWNVGPLSSINRISNTLFHNDEVKGVNLEGDSYMLDGERLMLVSGNYGSAGSIYETENESNLRVEAIGCIWHGGLNNGNGACEGPRNFKVYYPDGSIAMYGLSENDGEADFNHRARNGETWAISYYITPTGNKITYRYRSSTTRIGLQKIDDRSLFISQINYGYVDDEPTSTINFSYSRRERRSEFYYIRARKYTNRLLLKGISVFNNNSRYRNYELDYDVSRGDYHRLVKVTENSGDGEKSFNPTEFTYFDNDLSDDLTYDIGTTGFGTINKYNAVPVTGDYSGDGKIDHVVFDPSNRNKYFYRYSWDNDIESSFKNDEVTISFKDIFNVKVLDPSERLMPRDAICLVGGDDTNMNFRIHGLSGSAAMALGFSELYSKSHTFRTITARRTNRWECGSNDDIGIHLPQPRGLGIEDTDGNGMLYPPFTLPDPSDPEDPDENDPELIIVQDTVAIEVTKTVVSGDFNGNGLSDILVLEHDENFIHVDCVNDEIVETPINYNPQAYLVHLDRRKNSDYVETVSEGGVRGLNSFTKVYTGDFNGDGKTDLMLRNGERIRLYSYSYKTGVLEQIKPWDNWDWYSESDLTNAYSKEYPILLADFNGDGVTDICVPDNDGSSKWHFYYSTRDGRFEKKSKDNLVEFKTNLIPFPENSSNIFNTIGDFLLSISGNPQQQNVYDFSNTKIKNSKFNANYFATDIDQDGKADIFVVDVVDQRIIIDTVLGEPIYETIQETTVKKMINKSETNDLDFDMTSTTFDSSFFKVSNGVNSPPPTAPLVAFSNSPNSKHLTNIDIIQDDKIVRLKNSQNHQEEILLRQVTRGNGVKETIRYSPLIDDHDHFSTYTTNFEEIFPYISMAENKQTKVVRQLQINAYNDYEKYQDFRYREAVINAEGIGFLGFKELHQSNWYNDDLKKFTTISEFDTSLRGNLVRSLIVPNDYMFVNGVSLNLIPQLLSYNTMEYESELKPNKVFSLKLKKSVEADKLQNVLNYTENIEFDNFNNIKENMSRIYSYSNNFNMNNPPSGYVQETTSKLTFENSSSLSSSNLYYIGMPLTKETEVKNENTTGSGMIDYNEFEYNDELLITKYTYWRDDSDQVTEENEFDEYGNLILKKIVTEDDGERVKEFEYDNTYRFIEEVIEIDNTSTYYTYDPVSEQLIFELDHIGNEVSYEYDSWGNLTKEVHDFDLTIEHEYNILSQQRLEHKVFSNNGKESIEIFDALGREIEKKTKNFKGDYSSQRTEYFDNDLVKRVSEPYFDSPSDWINMEYDDYGRTVEVDYEASGKHISFSYNNLEVTEDDGLNPKTTVKNQLGQVVSLTDNGGTITYQYKEDGNLLKSIYGDVQISFDYDDWGRKTKLIDPSAGTYEYEYNQFGEVTKEVTPNGETIYDYYGAGDFIGQIKEQTIIGQNTQTLKEYVYDSNTRQIKSIDMSDFSNEHNINYVYDYDEFGRLEKIEENLQQNVGFVKSVEYGDYSQISKMIYGARKDGIISELTVDYTYTNGVLTELHNPSKSEALWSLSDVNERGETTSFRFGNTVRGSLVYDDAGFPTKIRHHWKTINIIDFDYDFDTSKGILKSRTSSNNLWGEWKENFNHDNQNQLKKVSPMLNGQSLNNEALELENSYDNSARITSNAQVGHYNYNSDGSPYQLESIDLT
ncbi:MAG: FG-GAP-like repeat-containing protein, partial [Flavobacteriaceae bacterium]|nr:FG-GAP-like repeat-containing protein [Flavobacteriaceae bacterium]